MAISALKTWTSELLTSSDLNAEFAHIRNNALAMVSPWTANMDAGGFRLIGVSAGTVGSPAIQFTSDTNTGIFSGAADSVAIAAGAFTVGSFSLEANIGVCRVFGTASGATGPVVELRTLGLHNVPGQIRFIAPDTIAANRVIGVISSGYLDATTSAITSRLNFSVSNAVNAGDVNVTASLSSLGVWTDASGEAIKNYIGNIDGVTNRMKQLQTLGVYVGIGSSPDSECHYSPTAEEFYSVFKLGNSPLTSEPGIAPKDVAWLAVKMGLELEERINEIERGARSAAQ